MVPAAMVLPPSYAYRGRETNTAIPRTGIVQIPVVCIARIVNEVHRARIIDCDLRLDATIWHPVKTYATLRVLLFRKTG